MPCVLSHIIYGLSVSLMLHDVSLGRFSRRHIFVFTSCAFIVDLGVVLGWLFGHAIGGLELATLWSNLFRDPLLHPLIIAPLSALLMTKVTSRRLTRGTEHISLKGLSISRTHAMPWFEAWALCVAGSLSRFFVDIVTSHANRHGLQLGAIDVEQLDVVALLFSAFLILAVMTVNIEPRVSMTAVSVGPEHKAHREIKFTWALVGGTSLVYLTFLWYNLVATSPAAYVGQNIQDEFESVLILTVFLFMPCYLLSLVTRDTGTHSSSIPSNPVLTIH